jgi:hypothetical protein
MNKKKSVVNKEQKKKNGYTVPEIFILVFYVVTR